MLVTRVLPVDKKRSRVWLDEEFAFVLYKGELRRYMVEAGKELSDQSYNEIVNVVIPKRAKLRAMNLLKSHTYSVAGLRDKLRDGFYPEQAITQALDYVASYGYTDDLRLAEDYIRCHLSDKSRQRITQDLFRKGIDKETITKAFDNCAEEDFVPDEEQQIRQLLRKRGFNPDVRDSGGEIDLKEWSKQYAFLMRRGYSASVIRKIMGETAYED